MSGDIKIVLTPAPKITITPGGAPGPAGPSAVSADADNAAVLGTDDLIYVPESSATWGDITGTLTDQTDLASALSGKVDDAELTALADEVDGKATAAQGALADTAVQPADLDAYVPETRTINGSPLSANIVLDADDFADGTTNHVFTAADDSKLAGIEPGAEVNTVTSVNGQTGDVVIEAGGGGGAWGDITGTLADQTDLAAALDDKADSADLGTAATADTSDFATAAQGATADSAVQPGDLGTAASEDATAFATAAQGALADTAVQPADLGTAAALDVPASGNAAAGEVVKGNDTRLSDSRTPTAHNHTASDVTDFNTAADARVTAGITGKLDTSAAPELIRDTMGTALVAGDNVTITPNDAGDEITIAADGGAGVDETDVGYDIVVIAGQSNAAGYSGPVLADVYDVPDARVWQYAVTGTYATKIIRAIDPLYGPTDASMTRLVAPIMEFARHYACAVPPNRKVLVVHCAVGATGLVGERWAVGNADLFTQTVNTVNAAVVAAGRHARVVAFLWVQGEHDANVTAQTEASYAAQLDLLIAGFRSGISTASDAAFIVGGLVPEWVEAPNGTSVQIHAAHLNTPGRVDNAYFADGPRGMNAGDVIHYTAAGARELGKRMFFAWKDPAPSAVPAQVTGLTATAGINSVLLQWAGLSANPAVSDYLVEYRVSPAGSWNTFSDGTGTGVSATVTGLTNGTAYDLKVSAINDVGTGTASAVVTATPVAVVTDSFTRANSASTLGVTETAGKAWTANVGTWGINTNQAYMPTPTDQGAATIDLGTADQRVGGRFTGASANCFPSFVARFVDTDNYYMLMFTSATAFTVYRKAPGGSYTSLKTGSITSGALAEFSVAEVAGSTQIRVYNNGVEVGSPVTDSTVGRPAGTRAGIRLGYISGTPRWDDFTATVI